MIYLFDMHRSESSLSNSDDLKRIKSLMNDLQENLEESRFEDTEKFQSMESAIKALQSRFDQMESRFDRRFDDMKEVSSVYFSPVTLLFWMWT